MIHASDYTAERWPADERPGGQHVGTMPEGVRVTHKNTGLVAIVDVSRSGHINRAIALDMIMAGLTHPDFTRYAK